MHVSLYWLTGFFPGISCRAGSMKGLENGGDTGKRIGIWIIALGRVEAHASHLSVAYVSALPLFYEIFVNLHVIS